VLEAADRIGGKVRSLEYEGRIYELGAVVTAPDNALVLGIAEELGLALVPAVPSLELSPDGEARRFTESLWASHGRLRTLGSAFAFYRFMGNHPACFAPGFEATPEALCTTWEAFAQAEGLVPITDAFRPIMVGCGYGFAEDMPAPYWLKLMKTFAYGQVRHQLRLSRAPFFRTFPQGWQQLWAAFAKARGLRIRLQARVAALTRSMEGKPRIDLDLGHEVVTFDRVIVTIPHLANRFMDLDEAERRLFAAVRSLRYKVTLLELSGLAKGAHLWPRAHCTREDSQGRPNDGNLVLLSNPHGTDLYLAYQFTSQDKPSSELRAILEANLARMRGRIGKVIQEEVYDYFPHFEVAAFKAGMPQKLTELQGKGGVYFTGALMNFETVELSAQHARALVAAHFPAPITEPTASPAPAEECRHPGCSCWPPDGRSGAPPGDPKSAGRW
jgi:phytoene dehydrogenase-like protein